MHLLRSWFSRFAPKRNETPKQATGRRGEQLAAKFLRKRGLKIVERNWRSGHHELDLVCRSGPLYVFVEVRTRAAHAAVDGLASLTPKKRRSLRRAILAYLNTTPHRTATPWRCDAVAVALSDSAEPALTHYEGIHLPAPKGAR